MRSAGTGRHRPSRTGGQPHQPLELERRRAAARHDHEAATPAAVRVATAPHGPSPGPRGPSSATTAPIGRRSGREAEPRLLPLAGVALCSRSAVMPMSNHELALIVHEYIGVEGEYLGGLSYYPRYCDLDIDPNLIEGTTRGRFEAVVKAQTDVSQARIVRGALVRFPPNDSKQGKKRLSLVARLEAIAADAPRSSYDPPMRWATDALGVRPERARRLGATARFQIARGPRFKTTTSDGLGARLRREQPRRANAANCANSPAQEPPGPAPAADGPKDLYLLGLAKCHTRDLHSIGSPRTLSPWGLRDHRCRHKAHP